MKRLLAIVAIAAMAIAALPQFVAATTTDLVAADHYKCYKAKGVFEKVPDVRLDDQFDVDGTTAVVIKPAFVCNPVSKNGSVIQNLSLHYVCYQIKEKPKVTPPDVFVTNQFQTDELLDVIKAKLLCVPSTKSLTDATGD